MRVLLPSLLILMATACTDPIGDPGIIIEPAEPNTLDDLVGRVNLPSVHPSGGLVLYNWSWTVDGVDSGITTDTVPADRTVKGQVWEATVIATDGQGIPSENPAVTSITIGNAAPTITAEAVDARPGSDQVLAVAVQTEDPDGDEVSVTYTWTRDGSNAGVTTDTVPAENTSRDEVWVVTAVPNDGDSDGEGAIAQFTVANVAPVMTDILLVPARPQEADEITAVGQATDFDNDEIVFLYEWTVNGTTVERASSNTLTGEHFSKGDEVRAVLSPTDSTSLGESLTSDPVVVQNTPPTLERVLIEPAIAREATELSCPPIGGADVDADPLTYAFEWSVDGTVVANSEAVDGDDFPRDQEVVCTVTVSDDEEPAAPVSSEPVVIQNTPPILASVEIDTASPRTDDSVGVTLGATTDDDDDTVNIAFTWFVNATQVGTDSTLDASNFVKGDQIVVEAQTNDGTDDGNMLTSTPVNVQNTPPTAPTLAFDPTAPLDTDDLHCTIDTDAKDADSDAITYTFSWTVDGSAFARATTDVYAGDTVKTADTAAGEKWECTVTANDGTDDGPSAVETVSITSSGSLR
ncbi:MAG: hypothetical protein AB8H79_03935 [Myxococcota bacterium]